MIYGLVLAIHIGLACFMIIIILLQGGRGGLGETMGGAAAQSLFGGGANIVMTKLTAVCAGLFMVTSLSLALLSAQRGRSVIDQLPPAAQSALPLTLPGSAEQVPQASPAAAPAPEAAQAAPSAPATAETTAPTTQ